jgi:hypothetical protein
MSLGVAIKGPEGIVLAADSRVTLQARDLTGRELPISYDNATKLLTFSKQPFIGAVTYGAAVIGRRTAHSLLPEFEVDLKSERMTVADFAERLSKHFLNRWNNAMPKDYKGAPMTFVVAGFDSDQAYGEVHAFDLPYKPAPSVRTAPDGFGMTWGGQLDIASRIVHGFDPSLPDLLVQVAGVPAETVRDWLRKVGSQLELAVPYEFLPLQDCVNLAAAMIQTTKVFLDTSIRLRGVGGPTDIAVITRTEGLYFVQRKALAGELGYAAKEGVKGERHSDFHGKRSSASRPRSSRGKSHAGH